MNSVQIDSRNVSIVEANDATGSILLLTPNHTLKARGCPEAVTPNTTIKICGPKTTLTEREPYITKTNLEHAVHPHLWGVFVIHHPSPVHYTANRCTTQTNTEICACVYGCQGEYWCMDVSEIKLHDSDTSQSTTSWLPWANCTAVEQSECFAAFSAPCRSNISTVPHFFLLVAQDSA